MAKRKSKTTPGANMLRPTDELAPEQGRLPTELRKEDEDLAMDFLVGVVEYDDKGLPHWDRLRGAAENKAREALIRLLRQQQLTPAICAALAILIGDEVRSGDFAMRQYPLSSPTWARFRKLELSKRGRGAGRRDFQRAAIACSVWEDVAAGTSPEEAKGRAAARYGRSENAIKSMLHEFRGLKKTIIRGD
jgi:hypothetical protein